MSALTPKTVTLVANVQNTLVWSGVDFQNALGFAIPPFMAQLAFSVQNNTGQVCYVGVQYSTLYDDVNLLGGKNAVAIPANTTVNLDTNSNPVLNTLQRDIKSITLTFISAAGGTVFIKPDLSPASSGVGGTAGTPFLGSDIRSPMDYVLQRFSARNVVVAAGGATSINLYTVPTGKRATVDYLSLEIGPTASFPGDAYAYFSLLPGTLYLTSATDRFEKMYIPGSELFPMNAGDILSVNMTNNSGSSVGFNYAAQLKEVF